jgi:small redox-active disulfide protein 2
VILYRNCDATHVSLDLKERNDMLMIKVLGPGCANCKRLEGLVRKVIDTQGLEAQVDKITDYAAIMRWPILSTPGLVVNDTLVSSGRIPSEAEIANWLTA